ncbi:hypothetical protein ACQJBY_068983 [Aegilops geniculata]
MNFDYISMMMNSQVMGYRIDCVKKFMFLMLFMDCWSLYILDTQKKIAMALDPTETDPSDEMKRKHDALAKKFQCRFCNLFIDMFGAGLVDTSGWSFLYPLVAQHEPCSRQDSGVHAVHYILEFTGLFLRSTLNQKLVTMKIAPAQEDCIRDGDDEGEQEQGRYPGVPLQGDP